MTTKDEALALALEALAANEFHLVELGQRGNGLHAQTVKAITAIKQAITPETGNAANPEASAITAENGQQAQEPVESEYKRGFNDGMNEAPTGDCWVRAVDEAMVGAHLGVADMADDYGTAKKKLNDLICWHVEVAQETAPKQAEPCQHCGATHAKGMNTLCDDEAKQAEPFNPDWSLLDATQESLREHMQMVKQAEPAWQPIETAPKDGKKIIVTYANRNGIKRTVMACWLTEEQAAETDGDGVGLEEGWYECIDNWSDYTEVAIYEGEPTHWMPLPTPPEAA
jgi:hypothetical protein